jgi:hypothetical protein
MDDEEVYPLAATHEDLPDRATLEQHLQDAQAAIAQREGMRSAALMPEEALASPEDDSAIEGVGSATGGAALARLDAVTAPLHQRDDPQDPQRHLHELVRACTGNPRVWKGVVLLAKRTQGSTRGPLTDLLEAVAARCAGPDEAA